MADMADTVPKPIEMSFSRRRLKKGEKGPDGGGRRPDGIPQALSDMRKVYENNSNYDRTIQQKEFRKLLREKPESFLKLLISLERRWADEQKVDRRFKKNKKQEAVVEQEAADEATSHVEELLGNLMGG